MQPVPKTPIEALAIFRSLESEEWERDYAAGMVTSLDEALPDLVAVACNPTVGAGLQQRVAEVLSLGGETEVYFGLPIFRASPLWPAKKYCSVEARDRHSRGHGPMSDASVCNAVVSGQAGFSRSKRKAVVSKGQEACNNAVRPPPDETERNQWLISPSTASPIATPSKRRGLILMVAALPIISMIIKRLA